jgi:predicted sugar kinase
VGEVVAHPAIIFPQNLEVLVVVHLVIQIHNQLVEQEILLQYHHHKEVLEEINHLLFLHLEPAVEVLMNQVLTVLQEIRQLVAEEA